MTRAPGTQAGGHNPFSRGNLLDRAKPHGNRDVTVPEGQLAEITTGQLQSSIRSLYNQDAIRRRTPDHFYQCKKHTAKFQCLYLLRARYILRNLLSGGVDDVAA